MGTQLCFFCKTTGVHICDGQCPHGYTDGERCIYCPMIDKTKKFEIPEK